MQPERWGMLPLAGNRAPTSADELIRGLREGLARHGVVATVVAEGQWPALRLLRIDLARASGSRPLPKLTAKEHVSVERMVVSGEPVEIEGVPAQVHVEFLNIRAGFASRDDTDWQVVPLGATAGTASVEIEKSQLEAALHSVVSEQARKHGVNVKSTRLELTAPTTRSVAFDVICTAKMFIASATLTVRGQVDLDQNLNATISGLSVSGDGVVASMAQGFIQPHLAEWNGRVIPLGSYVAGGLSLRDFHITTGSSVRINASLGSTV